MPVEYNSPSLTLVISGDILSILVEHAFGNFDIELHRKLQDTWILENRFDVGTSLGNIFTNNNFDFNGDIIFFANTTFERVAGDSWVRHELSLIHI